MEHLREERERRLERGARELLEEEVQSASEDREIPAQAADIR